MLESEAESGAGRVHAVSLDAVTSVMLENEQHTAVGMNGSQGSGSYCGVCSL